MKPSYKQLMSEIGEVMDKLVDIGFECKESIAHFANYDINNIASNGIAIGFKDDRVFALKSRNYFKVLMRVDGDLIIDIPYKNGWQQRLFDKLKELGVSDET